MLEIKHVSVQFSAGNQVQAVEDVCLTLNAQQKMAIVGETGSGKSVLLLAILRLLPSSAVCRGDILLDGRSLFAMEEKQLNDIRGARISYIPQGGGESLNPLLKVGRQVGEPLEIHCRYTKKEAFRESIRLLKRFHLGQEERLARAYPHQFSGGMRQRAMIAMGISANASIILADEPTKGLDEKRVELVRQTFTQLKKETLLCVTHDLLFAGAVADTICVMYAAQQLETGPREALLREPLHPYTQDLLMAIPENGMRVRQKGFALSHEEYQSHKGCRYSSRCVFCREPCIRQAPPLIQKGDRSVRCWNYAD